MFATFWFEFTILLLAAILGSIAIIPYSLRLLKESPKKKSFKLPLWRILFLSVVQNTVLFAIVIGIGLLAAHQFGHGAPLLERLSRGQWSNQLVITSFLPAFIFGLVAGFVLLVVDLLFLPYFPENLLATALKTTQWENFTSSFYGGINEELIMRLFGVSGIIWLLSRVWNQPINIIFWYANVIMAVIFALGHLPALKNVAGKITPMMLFRAVLLNVLIGLLCGWAFWQYGIGAAIVTHFTADIVYHVGGTYVLRLKYKKQIAWRT